jgi:hypothetical protein
VEIILLVVVVKIGDPNKQGEVEHRVSWSRQRSSTASRSLNPRWCGMGTRRSDGGLFLVVDEVVVVLAVEETLVVVSTADGDDGETKQRRAGSRSNRK